MEYPDEAALNSVLCERILLLPQKYNFTSLSTYFTAEELKKYRKSEVNYLEQDRQKSQRDVRIVHFTSTFMDERPWNEGCRSPFLEEWTKYKEISPWRDEPLKSYNRGKLHRVCKELMSCLPRNIRIRIAGFLHAYLKPLKYL